ncbi:metalloregulator ArsR/SmtB family transcription factor [Actinomycetospora lutea]|uniref:ArsR/SmtB family transcription factor n=1 Tax=Actinomycetospora lutea TaxID=663604 RepID=UPI002365EEF8|nr:metalloregulator ArsR/SmtB family transcription factor [Actinomycetospora lutea]MDD7939499.1 metalloregulator ArsR/SmtB family transcription factor [Actinomycetospora lutea]
MEANENLAFDALSDRVRRRILAALGEEGELSASEIAARIDSVGRTSVSSHLRVLRTSGVVVERRSGRNRFYSLDLDGTVRDAFVYLQSILREATTSIDTTDAPERHDADRGDRGVG